MVSRLFNSDLIVSGTHTATSGTFQQSLTVSGLPVSIGTSNPPLQTAYNNGQTILTTVSRPVVISGSPVTYLPTQSGVLVVSGGMTIVSPNVSVACITLDGHSINTAGIRVSNVTQPAGIPEIRPIISQAVGTNQGVATLFAFDVGPVNTLTIAFSSSSVGSLRLTDGFGGLMSLQMLVNAASNWLTTYPLLTFQSNHNQTFSTGQIAMYDNTAIDPQATAQNAPQSLTVYGNVSVTANGTTGIPAAQIFIDAGSVTIPAYTFMTDSSSGLYSIVSGTLGITADGVLIMVISGSPTQGVGITNQLTVASGIFPYSLTISGAPVATGTLTDVNNQYGPHVTIAGGKGISISSAANTVTITDLNTAPTAIVAGSNVTVTSGSNIVTIASTTVPSNALLGSGGIAIISGSNTTTIEGEAIIGDGGLLSVISGTNAIEVAAQALVGTANQITATSGSNTVTFSLPNQVTMPGGLTVSGQPVATGTLAITTVGTFPGMRCQFVPGDASLAANSFVNAGIFWNTGTDGLQVLSKNSFGSSLLDLSNNVVLGQPGAGNLQIGGNNLTLNVGQVLKFQGFVSPTEVSYTFISPYNNTGMRKGVNAVTGEYDLIFVASGTDFMLTVTGGGANQGVGINNKLTVASGIFPVSLTVSGVPVITTTPTLQTAYNAGNTILATTGKTITISGVGNSYTTTQSGILVVSGGMTVVSPNTSTPCIMLDGVPVASTRPGIRISDVSGAIAPIDPIISKARSGTNSNTTLFQADAGAAGTSTTVTIALNNGAAGTGNFILTDASGGSMSLKLTALLSQAIWKASYPNLVFDTTGLNPAGSPVFISFYKNVTVDPTGAGNVPNTNFSVFGNADVSNAGIGQWLSDSTSVTAPGHSFINDTNTGMYDASTKVIGFAAGGVEIMAVSGTPIYGVGVNNQFTAASGIFPLSLTVSGAPVLTSASTSDASMNYTTSLTVSGGPVITGTLMQDNDFLQGVPAMTTNMLIQYNFLARALNSIALSSQNGSGGSSVQRNGVNIPGLANLTITSTPTIYYPTGGPATFNFGDSMGLTISGGSTASGIGISYLWTKF